jgi:predicted membrane chloride channel (bestrophin family)
MDTTGKSYSETVEIDLRNVGILRNSHLQRQSICRFVNSMRKFMTTPVPFPLIQMTRTIVLFYIFTIPFVLLKDESAGINMLVEHCVVVFMLTYGYVQRNQVVILLPVASCVLRSSFVLWNSFLGLELVSIELDDPFGDDDNDFE